MLKFTHRFEKGVYLLYPEGNLVVESVHQLYVYLSNSLGHAEIRGFLISLDQVIYIDSTGIGALLFLYKQYLKQHITLTICNVDIDNRETFRVTELDKIIPIYQTEAEALADFKTA